MCKLFASYLNPILKEMQIALSQKILNKSVKCHKKGQANFKEFQQKFPKFTLNRFLNPQENFDNLPKIEKYSFWGQVL